MAECSVLLIPAEVQVSKNCNHESDLLYSTRFESWHMCGHCQVERPQSMPALIRYTSRVSVERHPQSYTPHRIATGNLSGVPGGTGLRHRGHEVQAPIAESLMADLIAALVEQFPNILVAQGKAMVQPDGVLDDCPGETVAVGLGVGHGGSAYPDPVQATQPSLSSHPGGGKIAGAHGFSAGAQQRSPRQVERCAFTSLLPGDRPLWSLTCRVPDSKDR